MLNYGCGHPRTDENTRICGGRALCRICQNTYQRNYERKLRRDMTPEERNLLYRVRHLPSQLEAARRKVAMLENEARRLGLRDLVAQ